MENNAPLHPRPGVSSHTEVHVVMKKLVVISLLALAPLAVHAECTSSDFKIEDFKVMVGTGARPVMRMPGKLVNHCKEAAAAQIVIEAKSADGSVVQKKKGWPAGTTNIAPGDSVSFDLGRMFHYEPSMQTYSLNVVAVRTW